MEQLEPGAPGLASADAKAKAAKPRATKTPLQKEVLEASYQLNQHPSVEHRKALGDRIGLTEQEVQAWFQNRRRRDKQAEKKAGTAPGGTPGAAAPATSGGAPGASPSPAPSGAAGVAPAGTLPFTQPVAGTPGAAGSSGPPSGGSKPKAPRAPKAPKMSPVPPAAAALAAAAPPVGLPPLPPGGPAGLARFPPPAVMAPAMQYAPAAAASGGGGSVISQPTGGEEETEDAGDEYDDSAAAAWEGIRVLCDAARATLPVPYREDGPPLGFFFDEPGDAPPLLAAGRAGKRRRIVLSGGDVVAEADDEGVKSVLLRKPAGGAPVGVMTEAELEMRRRELALLQQQQQQLMQQQGDEADPDFAMGGKGRPEDALRREQERLRRELLKQQEKLERDRRREEEERHREMERGERERRKVMDRLEKERAKEEARRLKEMERMKIAEERELRRMEAAREKERKAEERRRALEERKKEKETMKALAQQERAVLRMRHREGAGGPPDDEELEYRALLVAAGIDPATVADPDEDVTAAAAAGDQPMADGGAAGAAAGATPPPRKRPRPDLPRPEFPPPSLGLQPAWPAPEAGGAEGAAAAAEGGSAGEAGADGLYGDGVSSELLVVWSFLRSFADMLGLPAVPSLEGLLAALAGGELSGLLGDVHCALLRLLQADMEDAHDERERVGRQTGAAPNFMDKSVVGYAARLEEAWAWGFELDAWRAHLNLLTWPEVLRQAAVVFGRGRPRPAGRRGAAGGDGAAITKGPRIQGVVGEDVVDDGSGGGSLKLRMPSRYVIGTVKAAAWQVLAGTGPSGLSVGDLVRRIQRSGLREMRSSKTPEAVLAGGLARDVLFTKVAPATWALTSVIAFHKRRNEARRKGGKSGGAAGAAGAAGGGKEEGGGGKGGKGADGDTEMAEAEVKQEAAAPAVKQERGAGRREAKVKAEPDGEDGGDKEDGGDGGGAAPMDVDGGAAVVKQEEGVKQEPGGGEAAPGPVSPKDGAADGGAGAAAGGPGGDNDEESYSGDEDEEEEGEGEGGAAGAGDPWVATLLCGGYSALSLRDRIEALSFLCHAVLDGPSLRVRLETRTNEAAARRKALFEEAKNEKRKRAEEAAARAAAVAEEARKRAEAAAAAAGGAGGAGAESRGATPGPGGAVDARAIAGEIFGGAAPAPTDPAKAAAEAARRADEEEEDKRKQSQRAELIRRIDEECAIRAEPLGSDRRYNRYWLFTPSSVSAPSASSPAATDDAGADGADASANWARLWVECAPDGAWKLLTAPQQVDALAAALDPRGVREGALAAALARVAERVKRSMPGGPLAPPTPLEALPAGARSELDACLTARAEAVRLRAASCLAPDEDYTADVALPEGDCGRSRRLKRELLRLEAALPAEAVDEGFDRTAWAEAVRTAPGPAALRTCLGQLEAALLASPDGASPGLLATVFHRQPPLVRGAWVEVGREVATALPGLASKEILPPLERPDGAPAPAPSDEPLAWLPPTLPALALRLLWLDACIIYRRGSPPGREVLAGYKYTVRPAPRDAQPVVIAAAAEAGRDPAAAPPASSALPLGVGGGAVILTNVLADRGRVREASRRVPELPATTMVLRAREFSLPVEQMRASVAEAEKQGLAAPAAAAAAGGKSKGKGGKAAGKGSDGGAAAAPAAKSCGSRSVVVVSGRGLAPPTKNKGAVKAKGTAPPPSAARVKASGKGGRGKAAKAAAAAEPEEAEGDDEPAGGAVLLGPEDEEEAGFASDDDDAPEEGYDDPYDSDYR